MRVEFRRCLIGILGIGIFTLALLSCGGGGGEGNTPPVADAGADQMVLAGSGVLLDGGGSSDADGDPLTYDWSLLSLPEGSAATLANSTAATCVFTPDVRGEYVARLVVSDAVADSEPDAVSIRALSPDEHFYGGSGADWGRAVEETADGGLIIAGGSTSFSDTGSTDAYLVRTDAGWGETWSRTFGGPEADFFRDVRVTSDGGFIAVGGTYSFGAGDSDVYLVKTDAEGTEMWSRTFGSADQDVGNSVDETSDGGFIIAGSTLSSSTRLMKVFLIKTGADGTQVWSRTIGGEDDYAEGNAVRETTDGGLIIAGSVNHTNLTEGCASLLKTDAAGTQEWRGCYGGGGPPGGYAYGHAVQETSDGGFIMAGSSAHARDGYQGAYLVKTRAGGAQTLGRSFGGDGRAYFFGVQETSDGGCIVAGLTESSITDDSDVYLVKTDAGGNETWSRTFGGASSDSGSDVLEISTGGFVVVGSSTFGDTDVYLVETDAGGNVR